MDLLLVRALVLAWVLVSFLVLGRVWGHGPVPVSVPVSVLVSDRALVLVSVQVLVRLWVQVKVHRLAQALDQVLGLVWVRV